MVMGLPGTGKSVLAAVLCHQLQQSNQLVALFAMRYFEAGSRDPKNVLCSLAYQLASHPAFTAYREYLTQPDYWSKVQTVLADLSKITAPRLFSLLLVDPLRSVAVPKDFEFSAEHKAVMVLDALDESVHMGNNELLNILDMKSPGANISQLPSYLCVVVSSRPETPVSARLLDRCRYVQVELKADSASNQRDVRMYLQHHLRRLMSPGGVPDASNESETPGLPKEAHGQTRNEMNVQAAVDMLAERTQHYFLMAYVAISYLEQEKHDPQRIVSEISSEEVENVPLAENSKFKAAFSRLRWLKDRHIRMRLEQVTPDTSVRLGCFLALAHKILVCVLYPCFSLVSWLSATEIVFRFCFGSTGSGHSVRCA